MCLLGYAPFLQARGRFSEASTQYRRALAHNPASARALGNLGATLWLQGRHDHQEEARALLERAVTIDPSAFEAHVNLGDALADLGDIDGARQSFGRALALRPHCGGLHARRALLLPAVIPSVAHMHRARQTARVVADSGGEKMCP